MAEGEPTFKAQCHCRECQYVTGGSLNVFMLMPPEGFRYTKGAPKQFTRSDLEKPVTREFCAECGTHLTTRRPGLPAVILKAHGTMEGIWQGLQRIAVTGVLMVAPSYALGQERLPSNAELERRELILENLHYQILIPRNARLDTTGRPDCVKIWHPRSTRTMTFLELCSHSSPSPAGFTSQTTLRNGARVRYNIDRNLGGGSGGTEGELKGELDFGGRVFALTCRDQGEWGNTPDWCLNYVGYLEVRERH